MAQKVVQLGPVTFSSGATTKTLNGLVDDASSISLVANTATTTPIQIFVEMTDTGTSFFALTVPFLVTSSTPLIPVTVTSSGVTIISPVPFTQVQLISTGAVNSGTSITAAKSISV